MEVDIRSVAIWIVSIFTGSFWFVMFLGGTRRSARMFSWGTFFFSVWACATGFLVATADRENAIFLMKLTYFLGVVIASFFWNFFQSFPDDEQANKKILLSSCFITVVFALLFFGSDLMTTNVHRNVSINMWVWDVKPASLLFNIYFFGVFFYGIRKLYANILKTKNKAVKRNLTYMLCTIVLGTLPPSLFDIIFLDFGLFSFYWLGPITGIFWVSVVGYSVLKYQQMNIRLVFSEAFVIAMTLIFFLNIFVDLPYVFLGKKFLFGMFCVLGYFLIKSVLGERIQREQLVTLNSKLSDLNQNLEAKVEAQTEEVRKAYEIEKKANENLKKLDQNKSDFIIITQHHLRTPVSQIRWYTESILNGLYGPVTKDMSDAVGNIGHVTDRLSKVLSHFLDIAQLKLGNKIFNMDSVGLKGVIDSAISEYKVELVKKRMGIEFDGTSCPELICDQEKIKDVIMIILDNAIRYGKEGEVIRFVGNIKKHIFRLVISNNGTRLDKQDLSSILKDSFYRSPEAKKLNPMGMGVSLLVAKTIMTAHGGNISIEASGNLTEVVLEFRV